MRPQFFALLGLSALGLSGQTLSSEQFQIRYSPNVVTSLKHVHDVYDTDYVLPGRTLGDLALRYRASGETAWKQASNAGMANPAASGQGVSFKVGRTVPTLATTSRTSSSLGGPTPGGAPGGRGGLQALAALNDQVEPQNSHDAAIPFFTWGNRRGTREWVQYDFDAPKPVSSAEIYWGERPTGNNAVKLPKSWSLQYRDGEQWKDVRASGEYGVAADRFNGVTFDPVTTSALRLVAQLPEDATSGILEWRVNTNRGRQVEEVPEIAPTETFQLEGNAMLWTIEIRNQTDHPMEVGDLGLPLPFNTQYSADKVDTYTKRLIRHSFIGGGGSYIFWMRTNGEGPYLMVPQKDSALEYFDQSAGRTFTAYLHSSAAGADVAGRGGKWRQPHTSLVLAPNGKPGDSRKYSFRFRWAKDYDAVREVLYQEGGFDWQIVPGMTIPTDLTAMFSLRTHNRIREVTPECGPDSNYGYWYPGKENDGGAGGGFEPQALGRAWLGNKNVHGSWWYSGEIDLGFSAALRSAATVVTDDPIFGLFAYGGDLKRSGDRVQVVPKDGLRVRFDIVRGGLRVQMEFDRDGFAKDQAVTFDDSLRQIAFAVENRSGTRHETSLSLRGLPAGKVRGVSRRPGVGVSDWKGREQGSRACG